MEEKRNDERQMKKTEDKEMSSQHQPGFHKNSDDPISPCGAEVNKITSQSLGNGHLDPLVETQHQANTPDLANQRTDELLRQLMGEQESGSINIDQIASEGIGWWTRQMDRMNPEEFQRFYTTLGILRGRVQSHLQQRLRIRDSNSGETSTSTSSISTNGRVRRKRH
ncbi:hypothetical protein SLEP1_g58661 [Rubroshorea leprosula]|uniref:Uncharacterized protein n=1 Tax=Rubroshorea leprosula TaxID=152421 RepID=A0AAV5MQF4_9ROSI|nr:hypothetical protein SLEP1_g58661 [Rubroshorea leprosula]